MTYDYEGSNSDGFWEDYEDDYYETDWSYGDDWEYEDEEEHV